MNAGFYKKQNGELTFAEGVFTNFYTLNAAAVGQVEFPVDGWYWFETQDQATTFFDTRDRAEEIAAEEKARRDAEIVALIETMKRLQQTP